MKENEHAFLKLLSEDMPKIISYWEHPQTPEQAYEMFIATDKLQEKLFQIIEDNPRCENPDALDCYQKLQEGFERLKRVTTNRLPEPGMNMYCNDP